jgi:hypothetical protein
VEKAIDTSSTVRLRSSRYPTPDAFTAPFSSTLTTTALYRSSLKWFDAFS